MWRAWASGSGIRRRTSPRWPPRSPATRSCRRRWRLRRPASTRRACSSSAPAPARPRCAYGPRIPRRSWVGIDASEAMLGRARERLPDADLRLQRLEDELPSGPFDLVVSALAVHHLDGAGKRELFARVARVLRPGRRIRPGRRRRSRGGRAGPIEIDWVMDHARQRRGPARLVARRGLRGGGLERPRRSRCVPRYAHQPVTHPELAAEQAYVDHAYDQLDRMRSTVARTQEAMATEWAALNMEAWAKRRMRTFEDAERGLVFGRLDARRHAAPALRRPPLGARRRARVARRQLAGARRASLLHGHAAGAARRPAAAPLPRRRAAGSRTSPTRRSTAARSRARASPTSCSRSSTGGATCGCATSSRRSSPTSTG